MRRGYIKSEYSWDSNRITKDHAYGRLGADLWNVADGIPSTMGGAFGAILGLGIGSGLVHETVVTTTLVGTVVAGFFAFLLLTIGLVCLVCCTAGIYARVLGVETDLAPRIAAARTKYRKTPKELRPPLTGLMKSINTELAGDVDKDYIRARLNKFNEVYAVIEPVVNKKKDDLDLDMADQFIVGYREAQASSRSLTKE